MRPRILLDTNVWRRLADADEVEHLRMKAKANKIDVAVRQAWSTRCYELPILS